MEVTDALIDNLANLARLHYGDDEKAALKNDLQKMIVMVEKLQELDVTNVPPVLHMSDTINALRNDEVQGSMQKEDAMKNAPLADKDYFKVPKVINK
jgi:aspartyl-tRNA(Asn)/glutamyl-tRNA(Gln) amidotransferase subunit C